MTFKVTVLFKNGYAVDAPFDMSINDNDLIFENTEFAGCNAKVIKAFDISRTEYYVASTIDTLITNVNNGAAQTVKSYYALLTQSSTVAPTVYLMNDSEIDYLGGIVWTRQSAGLFRGTLTGQFVQYGTFVCPIINNDGTVATVVANANADYIEINTGTDGKLTLTPIEIKVFYNITAP